ncbi:hypothetical protein ACS0TY_004191 [Phlomoides rotata]
MGAFIGGLKPELASEVRVYKPKMYIEAVDIARLHNDHLEAVKEGRSTTESADSSWKKQPWMEAGLTLGMTN